MYIEKISIVNYKNLRNISTGFSPRLNCFIGNNGAGKTNILDALYYLSFCKSFFNSTDQYNINHEEDFFMLNGSYNRNSSREDIICGLQKGNKKQFKRNTRVYDKLSEHIGLLPLVMVSPSDGSLITGGSDERRKFMDGVISQYNQAYLNDLLRYNRALLQRNNLLKRFYTERNFDGELLSVWDQQLAEFGTAIHHERVAFIEKLVPVFQQYFDLISQGYEKVSLVHQADLYTDNLENLLARSVEKDRATSFTNCGPHKDDLSLNLGEHPIRKIGSQGQKKTFLAALKLAQYDFISEISGVKPILLLDDIFDKLDNQRVEQIVKVVSGPKFGQIFITDTNRSHLDSIIRKMDTDYKIFLVTSGQVENLT